MIGLLLIGTALVTNFGRYRAPFTSSRSSTGSPLAESNAGQGGGQFGPATAFCYPGIGGNILCPCGNPPVSGGRGCDNSSATGGAALYQNGSPSLSADTLVFTVAYEK